MNSIKSEALLSKLYDSLSEGEVLFFQNKFKNFRIQEQKTSFVKNSITELSISIFPENFHEFKLQLENNIEFKELINKNKKFKKILEDIIVTSLSQSNEFDDDIPLFTYTL